MKGQRTKHWISQVIVRALFYRFVGEMTGFIPNPMTTRSCMAIIPAFCSERFGSGATRQRRLTGAECYAT